MEAEPEKVYVAIGTDLIDGFWALEWALKKWSSQSISIVILHAINNICKDYVYTPFGKLPASSVNDEKVKVLEKSEQAKTDKILSKYVDYCGQVKAETRKINTDDKPFHEVLLELIFSLRITKLVMAFTSMRSSTWKSRNAISASFYVHRHKPEYCELFIICGGKLVFLKREGERDGVVEDGQGAMVAKLKEKNIFTGWLGKLLPERPAANDKSPCSSPSSSSASSDSPNQWEKFNTEIEHYFNQLLSSNAEDGDHDEVKNDILLENPIEQAMPENKGAAENVETLKANIRNIQETIQLHRNETKINIEKQRKAEWAISLATSRAEELEGCTQNEIAKRVDLQKELDLRKEELSELQSEVEEKRTKLKSILELQHELSSKLQTSSLAKSRAEVQLEKAVRTRAEMVQEIEELRRQRDVLQRRIEFCKEKDAIGNATRIGDISFGYRKFTASEIRAATHDFSGSSRLNSGGEWTNVYKGRIDHITVAIKLYNADNGWSQEAFQTEVKLLGNVRHPHLLGMIGFCSEPNCIVFEYMRHGCLRDTLFSAPRSPRKKSRYLSWHARIRIAAEICSGLVFLHRLQPKPIVHGSLNPAKILLDHHNVAKIHGYKALSWSDESNTGSDIHAFGNLILQLLSGRNWAAIDEEAIRTDPAAIIGFLDDMVGEWPPDLAVELCSIARSCLYTNLSLNVLMSDIVKVKENADELAGRMESAEGIDEDTNVDSSDLPRTFFCPINQDVMKNPHIAADGFSYELEAIEGWLATGHDTSPMTNLKLKHKVLTPNQTLRQLIQDWNNKRSIPFG